MPESVSPRHDQFELLGVNEPVAITVEDLESLADLGCLQNVGFIPWFDHRLVISVSRLQIQYVFHSQFVEFIDRDFYPLLGIFGEFLSVYTLPQFGKKTSQTILV